MALKIIRYCERCGGVRKKDTLRYCSHACFSAASTKTLHDLFWPKVDQTAECWIWTAARTEKGYGVFMLQGATAKAHRVAYELTRGPIPVGLSVLHRCDNPPCVNPAHLFLGTRAENNRDMDEKGRRRTKPSTGERNGMAKLTADMVRVIRDERGRGASLKSLATQFRVSLAVISKAALRRSWKHVE